MHIIEARLGWIVDEQDSKLVEEKGGKFGEL